MRSAIRPLYGLSLLVLAFVFTRLVLLSFDSHADSEQMFWRALPDVAVLCLALLARKALVFHGAAAERGSFTLPKLLPLYIAGVALGFVSTLGTVNYSAQDHDYFTALWGLVFWLINPFPDDPAIRKTATAKNLLLFFSYGLLLAFLLLPMFLEDSWLRAVLWTVSAILLLFGLVILLWKLLKKGWPSFASFAPRGPLAAALTYLPLATVLTWAWLTGNFTNYPLFMACMAVFLSAWLLPPVLWFTRRRLALS